MVKEIEHNSELKSLDLGENYKDKKSEEDFKFIEEQVSQNKKMIDDHDLPDKIINTLPDWSIEPPLEIRR